VARRRTSLVSTRWGDGTTRITIHVPDAVATRLHTYLEAFTSPRHHGAGEADRIPADRRRGQAFCSLLEVLDPKRMPVHGGDATTLIVTVPLEALRQELGTSELAPAERLTAAETRRLACTAQIVPAVLGGASEVLDLGRSSRLFRPAQRKAMIVRDRECRVEGCSPRPRGARPITGADPGRRADAPISSTDSSSAPGITTGPTTRPTRPAGCPTATCASVGRRDGEARSARLDRVAVLPAA
jgi:hypothetical protein